MDEAVAGDMKGGETRDGFEVLGLLAALVQPEVLRLLRKPSRLRQLMVIASARHGFDDAWYRKTYGDLAWDSMDPLLHYFLLGEQAGRWPNENFDPDWYRWANPDVATDGVSPLFHFLASGRREGRRPRGDESKLPFAADRSAAPVVEASSAQTAPLPAPPSIPGEAQTTPACKTVLFVQRGLDLMTAQYRTENYLEPILELGYRFETINEFDITPTTSLADILVLQRVAAVPAVRDLAARFRAAGRPVIYDIDDMLFRPERPDFLSHLASMPGVEKRAAQEYLEGNLETLKLCDLATVSTFALKLEVERLGKPAFVTPNTISRESWQDASAFMAAPNVGRPIENARRVRLGYFSGTSTHSEDFEILRQDLHDLLRRRDDLELFIMGELDEAKEFEVYGDRFRWQCLSPHAQMLERLSAVDINLAPLRSDNPFNHAKSELKVFEAALYGVPTIASPTASYVAVIDHEVNGLLARSGADWRRLIERAVDDPALRHRLGNNARAKIAPRFRVDFAAHELAAVYDAALAGTLRIPTPLPAAVDYPSVCVVAILYRKADEVWAFLESLRRQSYAGPYEVIFVDDGSPDESVGEVERFKAWRLPLPDTNTNLSLRIIRNPTNIGNCGSRNAAIEASDSEVVIIVDADCMLTRDFVQEHAAAYMYGDADAAFGPMNIETGERPPLSVLNTYEPDPARGVADGVPQDPINPESFVNAITRNFSVRRAFLAKLQAPLFDEAFSYSAAPDSGFGWEDVEMGCRLFKAGARFKVLPQTASIHVSHGDVVARPDKALRSLKNFARLHAKHPDIPLLARQWGVRTFEAIVSWAGGAKGDILSNPDFRRLDDIYERYRRTPITILRDRKLRILTYRWHVPHQYELYKLGHDFTLALGRPQVNCIAPFPYVCGESAWAGGGPRRGRPGLSPTGRLGPRFTWRRIALIALPSTKGRLDQGNGGDL